MSDPGEQTREFYRRQGRVQEYLTIKKWLSNQLCFDSKLELCDHTFCEVTLNLIYNLRELLPACITCYYPTDQCHCEQDKDRAKYGDTTKA